MSFSISFVLKRTDSYVTFYNEKRSFSSRAFLKTRFPAYFLQFSNVARGESRHNVTEIQGKNVVPPLNGIFKRVYFKVYIHTQTILHHVMTVFVYTQPSISTLR